MPRYPGASDPGSMPRYPGASDPGTADQGHRDEELPRYPGVTSRDPSSSDPLLDEAPPPPYPGCGDLSSDLPPPPSYDDVVSRS